ncbi:conserved hypothetical protein [Culex quinquefasciatus]|uniref:Peptidoglycan binding-like domain-containing protein n=1 Tax=Culex quinquefasciatus TaxID=7176 RepID=B0W2Q4_CULQU|nr:conserved hypothetical protein [Culex quinquefasciatus]|eukprot:XP_001842988.1 conserved hypothetical protein [Culex quinquefasciatus]
MDQLSEAVKSLQAFANLEPTGKIDGETRELLRRPRCGAPDLAGSNDFLASNSLSGRYRNGGRRQRRFVIQGQKWDHHTVTWSCQSSAYISRQFPPPNKTHQVNQPDH